MYVSVCVRERVPVIMCLCVYVFGCERESGCCNACVCMRERERKRGERASERNV